MSRQMNYAKIGGKLKARFKKCEELPHNKIKFLVFCQKSRRQKIVQIKLMKKLQSMILLNIEEYEICVYF